MFIFWSINHTYYTLYLYIRLGVAPGILIRTHEFHIKSDWLGYPVQGDIAFDRELLSALRFYMLTFEDNLGVG
jgi:hypothetical protein